MSGHKAVLASRISIIIPLVTFIHCCNHRLNLVVQNIGINVTHYQVVLGIMRQVFVEISPSHRKIKWFMNFHQKCEHVGLVPLTIKGLSYIR